MDHKRVAAGFLLAAAVWAVSNVHPAAQPAARSCVVIQEMSAPEAWQSDAAACATRLSPASTFKIPHALVALETGVIEPGTSERWDGQRRPEQPEWNKDHTVISAMRPSVVWFFQRIAPRIGAARMHEWLERMHYGNADTGGEITMYWLNGRLRISPAEQVAFLRLFYSSKLPIARERQRMIREALTQQPGTVQNSRGIHKLEGNWDRVRLNSKTGLTTTANGESVSWLVGALSADGRDHVFAAAVWQNGAAVNTLDGARLAVKTFIDRKLLPAR
jgi:beta-lactamase class D